MGDKQKKNEVYVEAVDCDTGDNVIFPLSKLVSVEELSREDSKLSRVHLEGGLTYDIAIPYAKMAEAFDSRYAWVITCDPEKGSGKSEVAELAEKVKEARQKYLEALEGEDFEAVAREEMVEEVLVEVQLVLARILSAAVDRVPLSKNTPQRWAHWFNKSAVLLSDP